MHATNMMLNATFFAFTYRLFSNTVRIRPLGLYCSIYL